MDAPIPDPYRHCEENCTHDLSPGVGVAELLGGDGPYTPGHVLINLSSQRSALFDEEHNEIDEQQVMPARATV